MVLGHRRLAVIDLEKGHQPLAGARPETKIVANGEIYNFIELGKELKAYGHVFRTRSDSEVAAHAYDRWDLSFLDRLEGMYALAIWDGLRQRLVLARDRLGEKPLFYAVFGGVLVFASELRSLLQHPDVPAQLDLESLSQYLCLEYVPAPRSLVKGIRKLEPGTALVLEEGEIRTIRYWKPAVEAEAGAWKRLNCAGGRITTYDEAVAHLRELLDNAVSSRLVSDVPLGVFLSGGIDSSAVAALAVRHGATDTFSIAFEEPSFDESPYARAVAGHVGSRHHERVVRSEEMPELVPQLGHLLDEPIGDASIVPTVLLARFAREQVTVALGGDGGDELFAGYPMHRAHRVAPMARAVPKAIREGIGLLVRAMPISHRDFSTRFKVLRFLRGAGYPPPTNHAFWMASFTPAEQLSLLTSEVLTNVDPDVVALVPIKAEWRDSEGASTLKRAMHLDVRTYLPNDILTKVDRASMSVGLEVRAPFLQRDVVDFSLALPASYHMSGFTGKRLLRDAVKHLLPQPVVSRPKKGFGMPVGKWLQGDLAPLMHDLLAPDAVRRTGLFRSDEVQRLIREHREGEADHRKALWTLLVFELWRRGTLEG